MTTKEADSYSKIDWVCLVGTLMRELKREWMERIYLSMGEISNPLR